MGCRWLDGLRAIVYTRPVSGLPAVVVDRVSKQFTILRRRGTGLKDRALDAVRRERRERETLHALENVSLTVAHGTTCGIIGPNGCGKSTLLQIIAGILEPDRGAVRCDGRVTSLLELGAGFSPDLTGRENVFLNASLHGVGRDFVASRFDDIVAYAELERFIDMPVRTYSSGMFMRLGFAVAIHLDPGIVLVDEAFAVGDARFQRKCLQTIRDFQRQGRTIILVSHDLILIEQLCSRAALLGQGRLLAEGPPAEVIGRYHALDLATGESDEGRRWGTGDIRITRLEVLASGSRAEAPRPDGVVKTREAVTLRLHYRCEKPMDRPVFGLAIHRDDGVHLTGPNTRMSGVHVGQVSGEGTIDYAIERLPLLPGRYYLSAAVYDHDLDHAVRSSRSLRAARRRRGRDGGALRHRRASGGVARRSGLRAGGMNRPSAPALEPLDAPFDQFQRYTIASDVARALATMMKAPPRVLDVGGHHTDFWGRPRRPIAEFLPESRSVSIDLPANPLPGYVRARGDGIPFAPRSFHLVCSVDVLEHVPPPARKTMVREATRVASRAVLLAAPFASPVVERAEALVAAFIRRACHYEQGQLQEHRELGLPDLAATLGDFDACGWTCRVFEWGSVWRWATMMVDKHAMLLIGGGRELQRGLDRQYQRTTLRRRFGHALLSTVHPRDGAAGRPPALVGRAAVRRRSGCGRPEPARGGTRSRGHHLRGARDPRDESGTAHAARTGASRRAGPRPGDAS